MKINLTQIKKVVDINRAIQNKILSIKTPTLEKRIELFNFIMKQLFEDEIRKPHYLHVSSIISERLDDENPNLTAGSNSLFEYFDPEDALSVYEDYLTDEEYEELEQYLKI